MLNSRVSEFVVVILMIIMCLFSCDPCDNLDCISSNYYGQFRIISAADGKDLLFGATRIYEKNKIRFFSVNGSDTTYYRTEAMRYPGVGYDSIFSVYFFPKTETAYMQLETGDIDTLRMDHRTYDSQCCGTITEITSFRYNGLQEFSGKEIQALRK